MLNKREKFPTCWIKQKSSPLQGVLTLKNTYFEPRYVLVMPLDKEAHEHRLRDRGLYSEEQIEHTLKRADIYCKYNQDHPGFFDMMISSGELFTAKAAIITLVFFICFSNPISRHGKMCCVIACDQAHCLEQAHTLLYPCHPCVTAVKCKRSWSFFHKCR